MCTVMVCEAATDIEAVTVPFVIIFRHVEDAIDVMSEYLVALPSAVPETEVGKCHDNAVNLPVKVHALVRKIVVDDLCPIRIADSVVFIIEYITFRVHIIFSCLVIKKIVACPYYLFHVRIVLYSCLIVY